MTPQTDADPEGSAGRVPDGATVGGETSETDNQETYSAAYVKALRAEAGAYHKELSALKKAETERQAQAKAAEEQQLAAQQKWQELAQKREGELAQAAADAKAKGEALERYQATVAKLLEERRKAVPKHVLPLLDRLDPAEQLAYIAEHEAEFTKAAPGAGFAPPKRSAPASAPATGRPITL